MVKFFAAGAVLCLLYYILIVCYAGITADFAWIWLFFALLAAGECGLLCLASARPSAALTWSLRLSWAVLAAGMAVFLALAARVVSGMKGRPQQDLEYVIVLGAQVKGTVPSRALRLRLERALLYAQENPGTKLLLSGGQGAGEEITEAECMYRFLVDAGMDSSRLYKEERSTTTRENLKFCKELYRADEARTGILSNDFHVCRALIIARDCGYASACGIPARSDPWMQPHYVVREVFALAYYWSARLIR